jgi:UDPglucose 6-dehydrogenase
MKEKKINLIMMVIFVGLFGFNMFAANITLLGTGYVGLITGTCLAEFGNRVVCADTDSSKIDLLNQGIMPIYEPGLKELVSRNVANERLIFTTNIAQAIDASDCVFIAVGTPMNEDGCADLSALLSAFTMILPYLNRYKIICIKSTVPVGTCQRLVALLESQGVPKKMYDLVSNPEFLREGTAISDFMNPDRIVIGAYSEIAREYMRALYEPLLQKDVPCVFTTLSSAETIKYASNAFLATKLSFINEIANLCDQTGADILDVALGMGLDKRIGSAFLKPGPGFGGSCFPKDCHALEHIGKSFGVHINTVSAALHTNEEQKKKPLAKLLHLCGSVEGKTICVLGLAFKSNTDDVRYSPAITIIESLLAHGACVQAFDPEAMPNMKKIFPHITYCASVYESVSNADAVIIMTEWDEFKYLDLGLVAELVKNRILVDMRNLLSKEELDRFQFKYSLMGRP